MRYRSLWQDLTKARLFAFYLLHFTLLFIVVQFFVFKDFYINGKSFIHQLDGFASHYSVMVNKSRALREFFSAENRFDFSTFPVRPGIDFSIFYFLASLFPMEAQEKVYDLLILLKIYLSGCAFSLLGFYFRQKPMPVLIGSISYAFCGFSLLFCFQQPGFYDCLIIMPLFIIGTEQILKGKRSFLFIILVFLSLASNVYMAYDQALLIVICFLLRYFISYNDRTAGSFFRASGRLALSGLTGILLSGLFILPFAYGITHMESARIGREVPNLLFYPVEYYRSFLSDYSLIISDNLREGSLGLSVLAFPCLVTLLTERKKNTFLKVLFILLSVMLMIPFFGYVFSGFNNTVNRWCYAYSLCISAVIMYTVPDFMEMTLKRKAIVMSGTFILGTLAFFLSGRTENIVLLVFLIIFIVSILSISLLLKSKSHSLKQLPLFILLIFACVSPVMGRSFRQGELSMFLDKDQAISLLNDGQYASLSKSGSVINDKDKYFRVNGSSINWYTMATASGYGLNGTSFYSSFYYPEYMTFLKELEMSQRGALNYNLGLDARAIPLTLAGVRYHAARVSDSPVYPYGFTEKDQITNGDNTDVILQNDYYLPIGFTYDKYISNSLFESLSPLDKQDVMTRSVFLETTPSLLTKDTGYLPAAKKLDYRITESEGVELTGNTIMVNRDKAYITLEFDGIPGEETYIRFVNLKLSKSCTSKELYVNTKADEKINLTRFLKDDYVYYGGYDSQMLCLGNSNEGIRSCTLYFSNNGEYSIDDLQIWSQNMSDFPARMEKLRSESLNDISFTRSGFSGNITTSSDKFLCFTLPYDSGWNCYVDGKKAQILKANIGFFGVELPEGNHKIEMVYHMPLLNEGIIMSLAGLVLLVIITVSDRQKSKKVHSDK